MIDNPRVNLAVAGRARTIAILLAVIGVLALASAGWVAATPGTSTTTEDVDRETVATEVTTSATVLEDGPWEVGTELEDNPVYTLPETPELTITAETDVPSDEAEVEHEVRLRHEADRDEAVFWEESVLEERTAATVEDGVARSETTVDIEGRYEERAEIEAEFDGVGTVRTVLEVVAVYDTGTYADEQVVSSPLELTEGAYWLEDDEELAASTEHSDTVQVAVQDSPNVTLVAGLAAIGLLSFAGAGFVYSREPIDRESARRDLHRHRYAEWISEGSIPMWVGDYHLELDTLEDVVDVAIDTNARVVHDRQRGLFAVVDDNVVYYHSERGQWEKTAWPELDLGDETPAPADETALPPEESFGELPDPDDDDAWERI
ncbi:DUF5305 domain-containing protein [Natronococcus occultus]|uniref:DUF5305 domain-containing protein n=1 Tax=Natronococcus occultus SP4 TaxID=694430 RepID=L0JYQ4_9EURY|nr:DUF5305 domain-containing protein [Natronococcus occultus]AGB38182.1 hypothetical protein Natoc_2407 [Natronococcus occultus SP4]